MTGALPALPYLAPWYRLVQLPGKVVLEHGQRIVALEGRAVSRLVPALLPLLDGTRTLDEIVGILGDAARPAVENVLLVLAERSALVDGPPVPDDEPRPFAETGTLLASLHPGGGAVADAVEALHGCSVAIAGQASLGLEIARLLRSSGVALEFAEGPVGRRRPDDLRSRSRRAAAPPDVERATRSTPRSRGSRFFRSTGGTPRSGRSTSRATRAATSASGSGGPPISRRARTSRLVEDAPAAYPTAPAVDALAAAIAVQLALGWLVLGDHYAPAAFYALELVPTIALTVHHVHRVPRCPVCSDLADVAPPLPWHKEIPVAGAGRA